MGLCTGNRETKGKDLYTGHSTERSKIWVCVLGTAQRDQIYGFVYWAQHTEIKDMDLCTGNRETKETHVKFLQYSA